MDAAAARTNREEKLDNVYDEIETHLRLIGKNKRFKRLCQLTIVLNYI
jgi:hypothetical protein